MSSDRGCTVASSTWLSTPVYTLHVDKKQESFDLMVASQTQSLEFTRVSFQILRGEFVQIIFVGDCHWYTVSNIGYDDGVVNVYDSMYSSGTMKLIASLVSSPAEQLVVRMMDV